jgi:hypothetical protein
VPKLNSYEAVVRQIREERGKAIKARPQNAARKILAAVPKDAVRKLSVEAMVENSMLRFSRLVSGRRRERHRSFRLVRIWRRPDEVLRSEDSLLLVQRGFVGRQRHDGRNSGLRRRSSRFFRWVCILLLLRNPSRLIEDSDGFD